jgi:mxaJ protein
MRRARAVGSILTAGAIGAAACLVAVTSPAWAGDPLRVCAQPDAMPSSSRARNGFENKIAELVGRMLRRPVAYVWTRADRGPAQALAEGRCDMVVAVPAGLDAVETTRPYYTSSYVVVSRADRRVAIDSMKDERLKTLRIGIEAIDGGRAETPPRRALADRDLLGNVASYPVSEQASAAGRARMIDDVSAGKIDIAVLWGPAAGYFVRRSPVPLTITSITDTDEFSARKHHVELISFQYDIAMGVRKGDGELRDALDRVLAREQPAIDAILTKFGVPVLKLRVASVAAPSGGR